MSEDLGLTAEEAKTLKDLLNFGRALTDSLTSDQIIALSSNIGEMLGIAQKLGHPDTVKLIKTLSESSGSLDEIVSLINVYHKSGALRNALELLTLFGALKNALSAEVIAHWAEIANGLALTLEQLTARYGGIAGIEELIASAKEAAGETGELGIIGLLRALKEPRMQRGIKFFLHIVRNLDI